ncbi:hypothetical protein CgunFtcFv8_021363 [Champsocephalus gunnari]|uniref:Uncharacterized protein n=1 Tax=Champsocephalus gunnari TaxID=52237 RepID=A0AAN8ECL0_CHAGU|nr:hypothetical protein CgunFtcFv8_021363 [Champsocephalus gunnari]
MHEAIGGRPSIDPSTLMDSATAAVASGSGSTSTEAVQSQATVDEEAAKSGPDSQEDVEPSTSAGPPPRKKTKRSSWRWRRPTRGIASTASRQPAREAPKDSSTYLKG